MNSIDTSPGRAAHRLYCHFVWPTLGRIPLISAEAAAVVERHAITLCRRLDAEPVCVRAFTDRLHLLLRLKPAHSPGTLVARLKAGTEGALQAAGHTVRWGRGYAVATVSGDDVRAVMRRIHRLGEGLMRPRPASAHGPRRRKRGRSSRLRGPEVVDAFPPGK